jgi:mannosyltransferase
VCSKDSSVATEGSPSAAHLVVEHGRWAFCLLLVLGFGIRLVGLDFHSLWLDEAVSVYLASFPLSEILHQGMTLQEPNPPLYHLSLSAWMQVFGSGEASVRLLSAFLGTLYLPAVYLLGRRLLSRRAALLALLLTAINPFLVWYSQEARMYALVATLSVWSVYCFVRALSTPRWSWWAAYVVLTVMSLYAHLYAVFVMPAELLLLLLYVRRRRAVVWQGLLAWGACVVCFSPWLWRAWQLSAATPSWRPASSLGAMVAACLEAFSVRQVPLPGVWLGGTMVVLGGVVVVGLLPRLGDAGAGGRREGKLADVRSTVLLVLWLLLPLLAAYVLSFRQQIFTVYYLIVIVAPFLLALAAGLDKLLSWHRAVGAATLVLVAGALAYGLCFNWSLDYRKEEWRAAARYVSAHAGPGDAVLCHADYVRIPFQYYFRGEQPVFAPFGGPVGGRDEVGDALAGLGNYDTVWLVQSHTDWVDPNRTVEGWLSGRFPIVTEQYPPGVEVKGYAANYRAVSVPAAADHVDAVYDERLRLAAYELDDGPYRATDDTYHPPSGWIHVTLYWEALTPLPEDYVAVVRLTDGAQQVWGGSLERATSAMRFYPPSRWQPGEIVRDDYDVNLNPRTPVGQYTLEVNLLDTSGEELPAIRQGVQTTAVPLGQVSIVSS